MKRKMVFVVLWIAVSAGLCLLPHTSGVGSSGMTVGPWVYVRRQYSGSCALSLVAAQHYERGFPFVAGDHDINCFEPSGAGPIEDSTSIYPLGIIGNALLVGIGMLGITRLIRIVRKKT